MIDVPDNPTPGFLVWRLSMKWRAEVDRAVEPFGLTHATYSVLSSLYGMHRQGRQPSQRELADRTGLDAVHISKVMTSLEGDGLVRRDRDPHDRRAFTLTITAEGTTKVLEAIEIVHTLMDDLTAPLGGAGSDRTAAFAHELIELLDPASPNREQPRKDDSQ